ncbi:hypothetical protein [Zestomonas carbonaria]|uniref:Uncharacterized protein n=1 Tax=Zestomonas carbonaria TaxID=2762745 RepID=A0A7U7ELJ2_9GAMM|nr:hypothetical protein [Pseudomonas carbonaria]CAD5107243.1 hypothetical protein PSEWESI4_01514 [Pseudomonas carbonaria]
MATLSVQMPTSTLSDIDNPHLTVELDRFAWVSIPFTSEAQRWTGGQALTTHWPIEANGREIVGQRLGAYVDDYYHRIHIAPRRLDLGNVVSTQTSPVSLWNAFLEPQTLQSIQGMDEGIEVSGQPSPPLLFAALQERTWQVSVTPNGQPVLDTILEWVFNGSFVAGLHITANRIIPWSFVPDWGDGVLERLIAATDILQSESLASQRRALRIAPRREFEASMYVEGRERQMFDLALFGWGARVWALPIWPDIQLLTAGVPAEADFIPCDTQHLDFRAGRLALLRGESAFEYEAVEIEDVTSLGLQLRRATQQSWPAGTRLYPVRSAQLLEQPNLTKMTDRLYSADVRFLVVEPCDWPAVMPATLYRGRPVWASRPDESEDLTHGFDRSTAMLDSGMAIPLFTDTANRALTRLGQRWIDQGRAQRAALRSFIYAMCGRQQVVWVPTHMDDLTLLATVTSVATTLDVENIGYTRFSNGKPGRRDIRIELYGGQVFMRRIIGAAELSGHVERLGLDSALGVQVEPHQVARISWMVLCRFNSDTQEVEHITDSEGVASWATVFREERDDEL